MKTTLLTSWAPLLVALLYAPAALAETTTASPTTTDSASTTTTTTSDEPSCTASLVTKLCEYPDPFRAVASSGRSHCWEYCNENQPCDFVIFLPGNPYLGTGTCWVYPGEKYQASNGTTEGCDNPYLEVYDKPSCKEPASATTSSSGACAATASPSAVASVCGYEPPEDCFETCAASSGASHCLSLCAEADACEYAVFNPMGETNSPYESGNCWVFREGKYDTGFDDSCGDLPPKQYVYTNPCPKPKVSTTSSSSATSTADDNGSSTGGVDVGGGNANGGDGEGAASGTVALSLTTFLAVGLAIYVAI